MTGEKKLDVLLHNIQPILCEGEYVFCTFPSYDALAPYSPLMTFQEKEGVTAILDKDTAEKHGIEHTYPSRMITLNVHSDLDAVGFLAAITGRLAEHGISVNPVSAYFHDHLFVPTQKANDALKVLKEITRK